MSRKLEEQTDYGNGVKDEWMPAHADGHDTGHLRTDADWRRYVREWNKAAKARGDMTRIRSVEDTSEW